MKIRRKKTKKNMQLHKTNIEETNLDLKKKIIRHKRIVEGQSMD